MKAASHFLRNTGNDDLAIVDTHIIKFMASLEPEEEREEAEVRFRKMATTIKGYETLEEHFEYIAYEAELSVAKLDALVWKNYSRTEWENFTY
jgi:thermostable 8-oxoguanine DNA glycosylase